MIESELQFKRLLKESTSGIALVSLDRKILDVNPAFERMMGYTKGELVGKTFAGLMYAEDSPKNLMLHQELLDGKRDVYHMERRYIRKDGSLLWTRLTVFLLRDAKGVPDSTMGIVEDITEQKAAEAKVAEQQQLILQASKMSALGEMASGIAHEIQTPLTVIRFKTEELEELAATPGLAPAIAQKLKQNAEHIERTVMKISQIVKSLRTFARQGDQDPFQEIKIETLVEETLSLCQDKFKFDGIEIRVKPFAAELTLECRPTQISQVLINLLNNARDAIVSLKEKWVELEVAEVGDTLQIRISDSGPGIPPEVAARLFHTFFTTKSNGNGTGLGLAISQGILESHRGGIKLDTSAQHTTFVIRLPKRQGQVSPRIAA